MKIAVKKSKGGLASAKRKDNAAWIIMVAPFVIWLVLFTILPLYGIIIPFKDFKYNLGIIGSPWVGLKNFEFFFTSPDFVTLMRNTIGYSLLFLFLNNVTNLLIAFGLYEIKSKTALKVYQTVNILPAFMSWVVISYIVYALLSPRYGYFKEIAGKDMGWYSNPKYWPFLLAFLQDWKNLGMGCIIYYAALVGIDKSLFEAAEIDGATKWQQRIHICIPALKSVFGITIITGMGGILGSDFGLFYQVPMDVSALYPTTDVISTYVFRGLRTGDMSMSAAVGVFTSLVGAIMLITVNALVKRIDPDSRLF